jgi:hypothetical protein
MITSRLAGVRFYGNPTGDNDMPAFLEPFICGVSDFPPARESREHELTHWIRQLVASHDLFALALERLQPSAEQPCVANSVDRAERLCDLIERVLLEATGCRYILHRTQVPRLEVSIDLDQEKNVAVTPIRNDGAFTGHS